MKGVAHEQQNLQQRLNDLFGYISQGKIIEAMNEFYDKDTVMQDNANPPTKGLAANIEREKQFLNGVKEWKGFKVKASGIGDNVTFYECSDGFYRDERTTGSYGTGRPSPSGRTARSSTSGSITIQAQNGKDPRELYCQASNQRKQTYAIERNSCADCRRIGGAGRDGHTGLCEIRSACHHCRPQSAT